MGVDEKIARFFVDRKVPADNIFWKERYVVYRTGKWICIYSVYYDMLFRMGVARRIFV